MSKKKQTDLKVFNPSKKLCFYKVLWPISYSYINFQPPRKGLTSLYSVVHLFFGVVHTYFSAHEEAWVGGINYGICLDFTDVWLNHCKLLAKMIKNTTIFKSIWHKALPNWLANCNPHDTHPEDFVFRITAQYPSLN